jgi:peptidoglycan/xylan/chitin deacetylase (PgdA/CDA1 family)
MRPAIFTLSLDFELIWGTLDKPKWPRFLPLCRVERERVVPALLGLFEKYSLPATWCVVGHLMLEGCDGAHGDPVRFGMDPGTNEGRAPLFYARELVEHIRSCRAPQEIGSHSFSHAIFSECDTATAEAELSAAVEAARAMGIEPRSFVFPRNSIGHLERLAAHGFTTYRGESPRWYDHGQCPRLLRRTGHLVDILTVAPPPLVKPRLEANGLWNVPASMLFTPAFGVRKAVPVGWRVARARRGLLEAARRGGVFHLWLHPTDLAARTEAMLGGLERVLRLAAELREQGRLQIVPMCDVPKAWETGGRG